MPDIVISDTSVLILLQKIEALDLLKSLYGSVMITPEVSDEFSKKPPEWLLIRKVKDKKYQEVLETQIDPGEASVIALAREFENPLLLLDDLKARKLAKKLNLKFTGTLGILYKAKKSGRINRVKPFLDNLLKNHFRISDKVIREFLKLTEESD